MPKYHNDPLVEKLVIVLQQQDIDGALQLVKALKAADIADILTILPLIYSQLLLIHLPQRAYVFSYLSTHLQVQLSLNLTRVVLAEIIGEMPSDKRTDVFKQLSKVQQKALMPALAQAKREDIRRLASYPEETAGSIMSAEYATLKAEMTVKQAIKSLRREAPDAETIYIAYVIDDNRKLIGIVTLKTLILANEDELIHTLMTTDLLYAKVDTDQDDVAKMIARYDLMALPIVDEDHKIVGIVTYDDAMEVANEEVTEDFLKSSGVESKITSVKKAPILLLYRKRVFWLVILVFGSLLSGIGISYFEDIIAAHIVLVFFLPLLVGSGGNAGSQSATLMVRALATGDVEFKDWFLLLGRESLVALCLGVTMATAVSILGYLRGDEMVALVLALSMMGIVLLGCLIGMSLPFLLNRLKLDPASASAPLVTSICDATGVIVYLFIASKLLSSI